MAALEIIKDVAGSKGELILYFKSKFWAWVDELRAGSVHRIVIYSLRPLSKLRRTHLKLFALGGNLFELSLATYSVRFINESLEFVYDSSPYVLQKEELLTKIYQYSYQKADNIWKNHKRSWELWSIWQ